MTEEKQENIVPMCEEFMINGVPVKCCPCGSFTKDGKVINYPNRVHVGNGFKVVADLRSIDQISALHACMMKPKFKSWISKNLPQSTCSSESEVEQS